MPHQNREGGGRGEGIVRGKTRTSLWPLLNKLRLLFGRKARAITKPNWKMKVKIVSITMDRVPGEKKGH